MMAKVGQWLRERWKQIQIYALASVGVVFASIGAFLLNATTSSNRAFQTIGGALVGAGITMFITDITSRRSIHEQYFKDANLKRRDDVYRPLHSELKTMLEVLLQARKKEIPYPQQIIVSPTDPNLIPNLIDNTPISHPLTLAFWPTFRADHRRDAFSPSAQHSLDALMIAADSYTEAMTVARQKSKGILARHIDIAELKNFKRLMGGDKKDDWNVLFVDEHTKGSEVTYGQGLAQAWIMQSPVLGWIIADAQQPSVEAVYIFFRPSPGNEPIPQKEWVEGIIADAWNDLQSDAIIIQAKEAAARMTQELMQTEHILKAGLAEIQDRFEGGKPII